MIVVIVLLLTAVVGCENRSVNNEGPSLDGMCASNREIVWHRLPYEIQEERHSFGGKSHFNVEIALSRRGVVCPYSVVLGDLCEGESPATRVRLMYYEGRCYVKYFHISPGIAQTVLFSAGNEPRWIKIECQKYPKEYGDKSEHVQVTEVDEAEFLHHTLDKAKCVRYVEIKKNRVVIAGGGVLKGYVLAEISKGS